MATLSRYVKAINKRIVKLGVLFFTYNFYEWIDKSGNIACIVYTKLL